MHKERKNRLLKIVGILITMSLTTSLVLFALKNNIDLFYSPTDVINQNIPSNQQIKIGGMVEKGTLIRKKDLKVEFSVTDMSNSILIEYDGILPDLFKEGQGVVAIGHLKSKNLFIAKHILAKHDENYMPREIEKIVAKRV